MYLKNRKILSVVTLKIEINTHFMPTSKQPGWPNTKYTISNHKFEQGDPNKLQTTCTNNIQNKTSNHLKKLVKECSK